ncbi:MAG: ERG2 family protein [Gammaproteobacteria bacterium]|nr:ERG2 family protein [Gammaproteobacteria bacterium]MCY4211846.1 ERG2 family protein [Gammaproteobacteria bacterium]MCY4338709.1 ERG2 family protein [Gammaproteobacteria bacterium]
MKYVFDPEVLRGIAQAHLDLPLEQMMTTITEDLAARYPGRIETGSREWVFNNAGGVMGQFTILYASLSEYLIFFGSPMGSVGHTGRYHFVEDYAFILDGEFWHYNQGDTERQEFGKGEVVRLPKGEAHCYCMADRGWILEYARGPIMTMLPFGFADTVLSTLDYRTFFRTLRLYGRHVLRSFRSPPGQ